MKFGLSVWPARPKLLIPLAQKAEALGFESVWVGEHVVFPSKIETAYPYATVDAPLPNTLLYDPVTLYSHLAALTKTIKLGTSVYILPLRHPLNIARQLITLDAVSGGRVLFGVGAGWLREEMDALQVDFASRGRRTEEMITVLRRLWSEPLIAHDGPFYPFKEIGFEPKPTKGTIPILLGGETEVALKRAAKFGDGWIGMYSDPERAATLVETLRSLRAGTERAGDPLEISLMCTAVPSTDQVQRYADAGVHRLILAHLLFTADRNIETTMSNMDRFANDVIATSR